MGISKSFISFYVLLALMLTSCDSSEQASNDWTSYFSSLQDGCSYPELAIEGLPGKDLIVSNIDDKTERYPFEGFDEVESNTKTYKLKNAFAFGSKISKVEIYKGFEYRYYKLFFEDSNFMGYRSNFYPIPEENSENATLIEETVNGYQTDVGSTIELKFDASTKTIECSSSL